MAMFYKLEVSDARSRRHRGAEQRLKSCWQVGRLDAVSDARKKPSDASG